MVLANRLAQRLSASIGTLVSLTREEGLDFAWFFLRVQNSIPGWLDEPSARLLHNLARSGPGEGAIVEIGSAWGRSTAYLARGSQIAGREPVYAIDPHTGDPWYLSGAVNAWYPPRVLGRYTGFVFGEGFGPAHESNAAAFSSLDGFRANIRRFRLQDYVVPVVSTSDAAAEAWSNGRIRLLFIDGLHTYEGVKSDIEHWLPNLVPGGIVVFDDYFNPTVGFGVRQAVDELIASGLVDPHLQQPLRPYPGQLAWTTRQ